MRKRPRAGRNAYENRPRNIGEAVAFPRFHFTSHLSAGDLRGRGTLQCPRRIRQVFGLPGVTDNKGMTTAACFNAYAQNLIINFPTFRRFPRLKKTSVPLANFVPDYRCGTVPELHRIPSCVCCAPPSGNHVEDVALSVELNKTCCRNDDSASN